MSDDQIIKTKALRVEKENRPDIPSGWEHHTGEDGLIYTFDKNGKGVCGAWLSKRHQYCHKSPSKGRNRCRLHGGASPRGIASPSYQGKGFSRDLPTKLADRYREAMDDNDLLSLRSDIAAIEVNQSELLSRVYAGDIGELWLEAKNTYKNMVTSLRRSDDTETRRLMNELGEILHTGASDYIAWTRFEKSSEQKRKLVDSERKRLVDMQQMITNEQLMLVMGKLVDSLRQHISDKVILSKISADIRDILGDEIKLKQKK